MSPPLRFADFELDPSSGELTRLREDGEREEAQRLAPQPALLLSMLIEKRGNLLTRQEIQERIWPDVEVDFEQGLNFCVRQVRAALGDSASEPRYIETLPRRGYRLLAEAEATRSESGDPAGASTDSLRARPPSTRPQAKALWTAATVAVAVAALAIGLLAWRAASGPPRIGVMPFIPPADFEAGVDSEAIGELILLDLTRQTGARAEVLGPRSTGAYRTEPASLRRAASALNLDYIINGKFLRDQERDRLLMELIRARDGAHVWVESFNDLSSNRRIAEITVAATLEELGLDEPTLEEN